MYRKILLHYGSIDPAAHLLILQCDFIFYSVDRTGTSKLEVVPSHPPTLRSAFGTLRACTSDGRRVDKIHTTVKSRILRA